MDETTSQPTPPLQAEKMGLWALIKEDFSVPYDRDPALHSRWEILMNYPGVWAVIWHRIAHAVYMRGWRKTSRLISGFANLMTRVDLHPAATVGRRLFIDHAMGVVIGETAVIGDDVTIYQGVTLGGVELVPGKRHPTVEDGVVIGAGAKVLGNIVLGKNAKIGANSVVIRPVPAESTAVGIPARVVEKGRVKSPLSHNKLPDIYRELFLYMMKRLKVVEDAMIEHDPDILEKDKQLEEIYQSFIKSME